MKRIQLGNTVFEGENNVYLLDGETTALVDTGVATPDVRAELEAGLTSYDVESADIAAIVLTHWHSDHAGLAGEIQERSGADVFVHEEDASLVDGSDTLFMHDESAQRETFDGWGLPEAARERLRSFFDDESTTLRGPDADVTTFTDGDVLEVGGTRLEAVHLPGHTAGQTAFAFDPRTVAGHEPVGGGDGDTPEEAFTGDAVLPRYTPNVGGADTRVKGPLAAYVDSLVRVVDRDWDAAHPGHRTRIDEPSRRAAEILDHHRHRTRRVIDVLADGEAYTAWEVSAALFGDLVEIHVLHGPGEAYAHLDHLESAGVVERDGNTYRLVDAARDTDDLFPTTRLDDEVDGADA